MKLSQLLSLTLLGLGLALGGSAHAKKDKGSDTEYVKIEKTGIKEIDSVFNQVKDIQNTLEAVEKSINTTTSSLNTTLGLAKDTPFSTAIADLKDKAEGKVNVVMEGGSPQLSASDAVPTNVQQAIDAVNTGVEQVNSAMAGLQEIPSQVKALQTEAMGFDVNAVKEAAEKQGMGLTEGLAAAKTVASNLKATSQTVNRATDVKDASVDFMGAFTGSFGEATGGSSGGGNSASKDGGGSGGGRADTRDRNAGSGPANGSSGSSGSSGDSGKSGGSSKPGDNRDRNAGSGPRK
jgi:archaellum component FlaC